MLLVTVGIVTQEWTLYTVIKRIPGLKPYKNTKELPMGIVLVTLIGDVEQVFAKSEVTC